MHTESLLFAAALGLESPWVIENVNLDLASKRLDIKANFVKGSKFNYQEGGIIHEGLEVHDTSEKVWRHLNFFQYQCFITARIPRVKLPGGKVRQIKAPWEGSHSGFTLMFETFILLLAKQLPVHQITEMLGGYDSKIWELVDSYVTKQQEQDNLSKVTSIGIDETHLGSGVYLTTFVDLDQKRTLYVHQGKDSKTIEGFVGHLKSHWGHPEKIKLVTCDMSKAFISGIQKYFENAEIVFDKFHVTKLLTEAVDKIRKHEVKDQPILKHSKFVFLKNRENLTEKQSAYLETIELEHNMLHTYQAMQFKEIFQNLYRSAHGEMFLAGYKQWVKAVNQTGIKLLIKASESIQAHLDGIITWFDYRVSNAILEGNNSLFKAAVAKARGYKTVGNAKNIILLISGKMPPSFV